MKIVFQSQSTDLQDVNFLSLLCRGCLSFITRNHLQPKTVVVCFVFFITLQCKKNKNALIKAKF